MKTTIKACEQCEKEYEAKRIDARYCSAACKQQAYLHRQTDEQNQRIGAIDIERRRKAQAELERLLEFVIEIWDKHIKDETYLPELNRKFTIFREAFEIVTQFNNSNKNLLLTDLSQLPAYRELNKRLDAKLERIR